MYEINVMHFPHEEDAQFSDRTASGRETTGYSAAAPPQRSRAPLCNLRRGFTPTGK